MNWPFMVSVRLMTYNHELYIKDAMEGIMKQEVSFPVEVVVGDDFSTDRTLDIIKSYASTDFIHVKILAREKGDKYFKKRQELGRLFNFSNIIENCQGKYIALLDGDDYWTDPKKLQKQVDFLEAHPDCVLCHHWQHVAQEDENGKWIIKEAPTVGQGYYPAEKSKVVKIFCNELRAKSRTIMFRNILKEFPSWFYTVAYGDVPLTMILGKHGDFGFINEPMAVYRLTGKGVSSAGSGSRLYIYNHFIEWVRIWELGDKVYNGEYRKEAIRTICYFYKVIFENYLFSFKIFRMVLRYNLYSSQLHPVLRTKILLRLLGSFLKGRIKRIV